MAGVEDEDSSMYRLEGSNDVQRGGLIVKKKPTDEAEGFKMPTVPKGVSLLGLDKLAGM